MSKVRTLLETLALRYPQDLVPSQVLDISRISFNIDLALGKANRVPLKELSVCDVGGGVGLFSLGCKALGCKRVVLVDDFGDEVNRRLGDSALQVHRDLNVEICSRDAVRQGIRDIAGTFDVVTCFDSMEHWHDSPKRLFRQIVGKLNPSGVFVLGVPNCVNLRKRITIPLGRGKWSRMQDWYEAEVFRGHVREPDVEDLYYIARDMKLNDVSIIGRNWMGLASARTWIRLVTRAIDPLLENFPALCSDLYLVGRTSAKPASIAG